MKKIVALFFLLFSSLFLLSGIAKADGPLCDESSLSGFVGPTSGKLGLVPCGKDTKNAYRCTYARASTPVPNHHIDYPFSATTSNSEGAAQCTDSFCRGLFIGDRPTNDTISRSFTHQFVPRGILELHSECKCDYSAIAYLMDTTTVYSSPSGPSAESQCMSLGGKIPSPFDKLTPIGPVPVCRCELAHVVVLGSNVYRFATFDVATPLAALLIIIAGIMIVLAGGNPGLASRGWGIIKLTVIAIVLIFASWIIIDFVLKGLGYNIPWSNFSF